MQVGSDRRRYQGENRVNRLAIQGAEGHRLLQETQSQAGPGYVQDQRVAHMRNGNAVAQAGGAEFLPCQHGLEEKVAVHVIRQAHVLDDIFQDPLLVAAFDAVEDAAVLQRRIH